jgi:hypothetical protein
MDDRLDDMLRDAARDYNQPPETPREIMWARIVARRAEEAELAEAAEGAERAEKAERADRTAFRYFRSFRNVRTSFGLAAGIAALLALGIGLGRLTAPESSNGLAPEAMTPAARGNVAYHLATTEHLSQSEAFLTLFRASVRGRGDERLASATARQLLATNRLLLDSPAANDARMRLLLQDLELVLAEITQLSPQPRDRDLDLIAEGLGEGGVLSRLRTAVPAGAGATQGAL